MKKLKHLPLAIAVAACLFCSSCATVFGGQITACQRTKPAHGQPSRAIRPAALVFDIILGGVIFTAIDFIDCAIYVPCTSNNAPPAHYRN